MRSQQKMKVQGDSSGGTTSGGPSNRMAMRRNRQQVSDTFLTAEANAKEKILDQAKYFQD